MKNVAAYDEEIRTSFRPAFTQLRSTLSAYGAVRSIDAVAATLHQGAAFEAGAMQTIMQFNLTRPQPTSNAAFTAAGLVAPTQAPAQPTPLFGAMMAMPPPQQQQPALMFYPPAPSTALAARPAGSVSSTPQERSSELKEEITAELSAKISGEVAKLKEALKDELKTEITSEQNAYLNDEFLEEWEIRTMTKLFPRLVDVLRDELKEMVAAAGMPPALKKQKKLQQKEEEKAPAAE